MRALLVTGSRCLLGSRHEYAVRGEIARAVKGAFEVWDGGAPGPDLIASIEAANTGKAYVEYLTSGHVLRVNGPLLTKSFWRELIAYEPIARNRAMVAAFHAAFPGGLVLALVAEWSKTHGTEYTLKLARKVGLDTLEVRYER